MTSGSGNELSFWIDSLSVSMILSHWSIFALADRSIEDKDLWSFVKLESGTEIFYSSSEMLTPLDFLALVVERNPGVWFDWLPTNPLARLLLCAAPPSSKLISIPSGSSIVESMASIVSRFVVVIAC